MIAMFMLCDFVSVKLKNIYVSYVLKFHKLYCTNISQLNT